MWKSNEIKKLIELYPNQENVVIGELLGKSKSSIDNKGYRLGLKKSENFINIRNKNAINKRKGNNFRDLTYQVLNDIAKQYKTKIEFIRNDSSAYNTARKSNILDEICSHMSVLKFSTPQLILQNIIDELLLTTSTYNNRKVIKPYEIDIYYEKFKLGFEYQGLYWHGNENNNDKLKIRLCDEVGVTLIHIFEDTRDYESDIKKQIINNLDVINEVTNNNITKEKVNDIEIDNIYKNLYNKKELLELTKKYNSFKIFKKENPKIYKKLLQLKMVDEVTSHMGDKRRKLKLSTYEIKKIVNNYNNLTDFRKENLKLYKHLKRNKKDFLIKHLKRKP